MTDNLEERALALIKSKPRGVLQSELWKDLDIDSRKCSRVVAKLEAEGKVKRTWETVSGTRTYRLSYVETKKEVPKKEYRFDLIMADDQVAPCVGCTYECEPDYCPDLGLWIELLAREEKRSPTKVAPAEVAPSPELEAAEEAEAPPAKPAKAARVAKKGKVAPLPEEEGEEEEAPVRPAGARKGKAVHVPEPEEEEEEEAPRRPVRKGKKAPEPEEEEEPVKPAGKGKKVAAPETPVKMAKTAARKGKAVPEPEEEEEEEKPAPKRKATPKAPAVKEEKKAPAKKRK